MVQPQIHVLLDDNEVPDSIATALRRVDAGIRLSRLESELTSPSKSRPDVRLIIANREDDQSLARFSELVSLCDQSPCATLVLTPRPVDASKIVRTSNGTRVGFASGLTVDELSGRLSAMCALQQPFEDLRKEVAELKERERIQSAHASEYEEQMRLARQIQQDLLPNPLPDIEGASLYTLFRPAEPVSGDIYDVARLDETNVALSCADATGHGMPAALLTMMVKRTMVGKQVGSNNCRILAPDEVLQQLNRELLEAELTHCQFVTGVYCLYDQFARTLTWARGGAPYPILVRPGEPARRLFSDGSLLGALESPNIECLTVYLQPGDTVILRTDGVDALLLTKNSRRVHDDITETSWFRELGSKSIADHLADLVDRLEATPRSVWPVDDLTVMALEVN